MPTYTTRAHHFTEPKHVQHVDGGVTGDEYGITLRTVDGTETSSIPPALWASCGLEIVSIKLPLSLPSPQAFDPATLGVARAYITFSKPNKTLSESLQKYRANRIFLFSIFCFLRFLPSITCGAVREPPDCNWLFCYVFSVLLLCPLPAIAGNGS